MEVNMKQPVYTTYDPTYETWNAVNQQNECVFYGSIHELEQWLQDNNDFYEESDLYAA
jgi:hypothetical protein